MITEIKKNTCPPFARRIGRRGLQRLEIGKKIAVICFRLLRFARNGVCVVILLFSSSSHAEVVNGWLITKGHFCTLYINQNVDIKVLNRKINTYNVDFGLSEKPRHFIQNPEDEILYKFDLVFLKVEQLLDMRPKDIRLNVKIHQKKEDIDKVYVEIFNEENKFIAFYVFKLNTLFACEEKISVSVVAHEIAHCIIDHHFTVPPPKRIAEMIAHYAELHLRERE